jgi:ABC-type nitrate/sulfonate/bicarbonate transport system substrate-binding protein
MTATPYTDAEATDEAVLIMLRKLRRLHPDAYAAVLGALSDGARDALTLADNRAERVRAIDDRNQVTRRFVTIAERCDVSE